jgi:hypothetical protein
MKLLINSDDSPEIVCTVCVMAFSVMQQCNTHNASNQDVERHRHGK